MTESKFFEHLNVFKGMVTSIEVTETYIIVTVQVKDWNKIKVPNSNLPHFTNAVDFDKNILVLKYKY